MDLDPLTLERRPARRTARGSTEGFGGSLAEYTTPTRRRVLRPAHLQASSLRLAYACSRFEGAVLEYSPLSGRRRLRLGVGLRYPVGWIRDTDPRNSIGGSPTPSRRGPAAVGIRRDGLLSRSRVRPSPVRPVGIWRLGFHWDLGFGSSGATSLRRNGRRSARPAPSGTGWRGSRSCGSRSGGDG